MSCVAAAEPTELARPVVKASSSLTQLQRSGLMSDLESANNAVIERIKTNPNFSGAALHEANGRLGGYIET